MRPLYFAALAAIAAYDMVKMTKSGCKKRVLAAYAALMLAAAAAGAMAFYTEYRILGFFGL